jgi:Cellulase (glycosyl hydrolase family 5)
MHPAVPNRLKFALTAAVLALLYLGAAALPSSADAKRRPAKVGDSGVQLRGVNLTPNRAFMIGPYGFSEADNAREIDSACALNATVVRLFVSVPDLESQGPGLIDSNYASRLDSLMSESARCGLRVIMSLGGAPKWDSTAPDQKFFMKYPALDGAAYYHDIAGWAMRRWAGLYAIEVANEPNLTSFWMGTPGQYADLVNAAVAAKREAGSGTLIIAGALSGDGAAGYLQQLYAAGMRGQDAVSIHPYSTVCHPLCRPFVDPARAGSPFRSSIESVHRTMVQNHDPSEIFLTEFGFSSCPSVPVCVSARVQAAWTSKSIQVADCYPYLAGLTTFTLRDITVPPTWDATSWNFHFGLLGADFSPKPAFTAVSSAYRQLNRADAAARSARARKTVATAGTAKCRRLIGRGGSAKKRAKRR